MYKKVLIVLVMMTIGLYGFTSLFNQQTISKEERRHLASFPNVIEGNRFNDDFFDELEKYLSDHMFFRNDIRKLKTFINHDLLLMKDINGIYEDNGYLYELGELKTNNVSKTISILNELNNTKFKDCNTYFMSIPRKNDFLDKELPDYKYEDITKLIKEKYKSNYIDLKPYLSLDKYYRTDIHWDMSKIDSVKELVLDSYKLKDNKIDFEAKYYEEFYGALYAKANLNIKPDQLTYLDSTYFNNVEVHSIEDKEVLGVYNVEGLSSLDPYNVFLNGPKANLKIINNNIESNEKLVVIRDSFASSLLPLLIPSFKEIEVIDLRYYHRNLLEEYPKDTKVLYLLSSEVINSGAIK